VNELPTVTPVPKSLSTKASEAAAKYLPDVSKNAEEKARWDASNSGSLKTASLPKDGVAAERREEGHGRRDQGRKGKHDKGAEFAAKIKKNEIRSARWRTA